MNGQADCFSVDCKVTLLRILFISAVHETYCRAELNKKNPEAKFYGTTWFIDLWESAIGYSQGKGELLNWTSRILEYTEEN